MSTHKKGGGKRLRKAQVKAKSAKAHRAPSPRSHRKPTMGIGIGDEVPDAEGLTPRQHRFIEEYLVCLNASEAARRAGYSLKTAGEIGYENLKKPEIRSRIDGRLPELGMGRSELLARIADIARGNINDCISFDRKGRAYIDLRKVKAAGKMHQVRKYKIGVQGVSVELYSALEAQDKLARILKLYTELGDPERPLHVKVEDVEAMRAKRWEQVKSALSGAISSANESDNDA